MPNAPSVYAYESELQGELEHILRDSNVAQPAQVAARCVEVFIQRLAQSRREDSEKLLIEFRATEQAKARGLPEPSPQDKLVVQYISHIQAKRPPMRAERLSTVPPPRLSACRQSLDYRPPADRDEQIQHILLNFEKVKQTDWRARGQEAASRARGKPHASTLDSKDCGNRWQPESRPAVDPIPVDSRSSDAYQYRRKLPSPNGPLFSATRTSGNLASPSTSGPSAATGKEEAAPSPPPLDTMARRSPLIPEATPLRNLAALPSGSPGVIPLRSLAEGRQQLSPRGSSSQTSPCGGGVGSSRPSPPPGAEASPQARREHLTGDLAAQLQELTSLLEEAHIISTSGRTSPKGARPISTTSFN